MKITLNQIAQGGGPNLAIRCPHCGHNGTFLSLSTDITETTSYYVLGQRMCPNQKCKGHIFFVASKTGEVLRIYPGDTIPFDKTNIPERILNTFNEAISCHSTNCFIASAIMIRKTLECICDDKTAKGKNLKEKLQDLGKLIMIPLELVQGMDDLRLLGNDAAHIENKTFEEIGKLEIEVSIEFTKEILKATYQYENLLSQLRSLKKPTP